VAHAVALVANILEMQEQSSRFWGDLQLQPLRQRFDQY
jgi:hypothetical protein